MKKNKKIIETESRSIGSLTAARGGNLIRYIIYDTMLYYNKLNDNITIELVTILTGTAVSKTGH